MFGILFPNALRPCNLRGRDAITLLPESVRDHQGSARSEVAGHSNLETPELEKVRVFNALKVFPIGDLPLFAHVIKEGVHFDSFRIVKLAAVEIPAGRGAVGADRVHNGHHCEGSRSQAVTRANGTAKVVAEIWAAREGGRETSNRSVHWGQPASSVNGCRNGSPGVSHLLFIAAWRSHRTDAKKRSAEWLHPVVRLNTQSDDGGVWEQGKLTGEVKVEAVPRYVRRHRPTLDARGAENGFRDPCAAKLLMKGEVRPAVVQNVPDVAVELVRAVGEASVDIPAHALKQFGWRILRRVHLGGMRVAGFCNNQDKLHLAQGSSGSAEASRHVAMLRFPLHRSARTVKTGAWSKCGQQDVAQFLNRENVINSFDHRR